MRKKISILGSTGSIGESTLQVAAHLPDEIEVVALAAGGNSQRLLEQALRFRPKLVALSDERLAKELQKAIPFAQVVWGENGLRQVATFSEADLVVSAISGAAGVLPTFAAIQAGKAVALANKEVLVAAGTFVMEEARRRGVTILPIDSEHSALFQALVGEEKKAVRRLIITASGGPFRTTPAEKLATLTVEEALQHPTYRMGSKITIDSSTLMNKGLEMIEAHFLFAIPVDQIEVVVHPQSIIHSIVEFVDGSMKMQASEPDMVLPIQYALTYPKRREGIIPPFDFLRPRVLEFYPPDLKKFPALSLAYQALRQGGSTPCYLNAANEVLVDRFMRKEISWMEITGRLMRLLDRHSPTPLTGIDEFLAVDRTARQDAMR